MIEKEQRLRDELKRQTEILNDLGAKLKFEGNSTANDELMRDIIECAEIIGILKCGIKMFEMD